jgi:hypothetical protein
MKHGITSFLVLVATVFAVSCLHVAVARAQVAYRSAKLVRYVENPRGLSVGLWANYSRSGDVLRDFGPRPIERVNFHKWSQFERPDGTIDLTNAFKWESSAQSVGSTVITNLNTFFTLRLNPEGMGAIPPHYVQDITNPDTRRAARKFLRAFVKKMLQELGGAWLVLDYEMIWFAKPVTQEIRNNYRDWFLEAASIAREAAAEIGMSDRLRIGVVVNTDPFDTAGHSVGSPAVNHRPQDWLLDCVRASDFLGIDTYAGGHDRIVTPEHQLRAIRFWIEHYAGDKPVYVTEAGFTTSREAGDTSNGYHIRGSEAEQAAYIDALFAALVRARSDPADLLGRVKGICIWKYADREEETSLVERHFGLVRSDGTRKPAHARLKAAIDAIESDPTLSPFLVEPGVDVLPALQARHPIELSRVDGQNFHGLRVELDGSVEKHPVRLRVVTDKTATLMVRRGDSAWQTTHPKQGTVHELVLPPSDGTLDIRFGSPRFPANIRILEMDAASAAP